MLLFGDPQGMSTLKSVADTVSSPLLRNPMSMALGANLKRIREERGLTQQNLAFSAEMDRTFISLCERGATNPSLYSLGALCWCLKITLAELFAGIEHTLPPSAVNAKKRRRNQASHEPRPPSAATLKRAETIRMKKLAKDAAPKPAAKRARRASPGSGR